MKCNKFIVFMIMIILEVWGEFIFDFMYRNFFYDNRVILEINVIFILNFYSVIDCVFYCMRCDECEFILFNMDICFC